MSNLNANEEDQQSLAAFRKSYPIGFSLHDDNGEHCLYFTDDANGQKLHLELSNTSQQNIELAELNSGEATSANHHVELRFRPGTLRLDSLDQISLVNPDWKLSYKNQNDGTVSLYFLHINTSDEKTLKPSEKINLTLLKVGAAADSGARVTQVELKYQKLSYENDTTGFISGSRVQRLSVVNHLGQQNIPLHVGFVGSNTILNDGNSESELILRITNVLKKDRIPLNPASSGNNAFKFIIYFDIQSESESKDWALGTKSEVNNISIEGKDWKSNGTEEADWKVVKEPEGELPRWVLTHQNETEPGLAPGQVVQLTIKNIKSSLPSGHTNLYVRYENIPGYWDGEFVCTIEKTPLLYRDTYDGKNYQARQSKVGIGTTSPKTQLHVEGNLYIKDKVGIGTTSPFYPLEIKTAYGSNGLVHTAGQSDKQIKLATYVKEDEGGYIKTISNHSLHFAVGDNNPSMTINTEGNIGIGILNPKEKLEVNGRIKDQTGYIMPVGTIVAFAGNTEPHGWLICDGRNIPSGKKYENLRELIKENKTPNLSGRTLIGAGTLIDVDDSKEKYSLGETGGHKKHLLTVEEMPAHNHSYHKPMHNYGHRDGGYDWTRYGHQDQKDDGVTQPSGKNKAHNNMQPYFVVNYIIKY